MNSDKVAWVFPGQGASAEALLAQVKAMRTLPEAEQSYRVMCEILGSACADLANGRLERLNTNRTSSLIATFLGTAAMAHLRASPDLANYHQVFATAGYSVGEWTALHAAGALGLTELYEMVSRRAEAMDETIARVEPGGMLGVVGVAETDMETVCARNREAGGTAAISNYNSTTNLTVAGRIADLDAVAKDLQAMQPKVLGRLPVAGAWHSAVLNPAADAFAEILAKVELAGQAPPVIDNTTGGWLPENEPERRERLAAHLCQPVRWYQGLDTLILAGATTIVELGGGNMLSTFGMFYDRSVRHIPFSTLSVPFARALRAR